MSTFNIGSEYTKQEIGRISNEPTLVNSAKLSPGLFRCKNSNTIIIWVDLDKKSKKDNHKFNDYFDGNLFHWDSQPQLNINTPTIKSIVDKTKTVLLFARIYPSVKGVTQPFIYSGKLIYVEHDPSTANPVHIVFNAVDFEPGKTEDLDEIYFWSSGQQTKLARPLIAKQTSRKAVTAAAPETLPESEIDENQFTSTEKETLVKQRIKQGVFRDELLKKFNRQCTLTKLDNTELLIASHIKPWSKCTDQERLDPNNGLLLASPVDALFDKYLISFFNDGTICISHKLGLKAQQVFGIKSGMKLQVPPSPETQKYLNEHRAYLLK